MKTPRAITSRSILPNHARWGALLRKKDYVLDGGDDPDELTRSQDAIEAARAAVAGDPEPVDAEVVDA